MKKIGSILVFFICVLAFFISNAQTTFTAKAPQTVGVNEGFTVSYTINTKKPSNFIQPNVSGAKIVAGPYTSSSSSTTIINGKMSSSSSVTFSYTLVAQKEGTVTISPAKVQADGQTYTSNSLTVKAINNPSMAQRGYNQRQQQNNAYSQYQNQQRQYGNQPQTQTNQQSSDREVQIDDKAMFVRAIPSKTDVVKGEEVIITYKLYTLLPVSEYQIEKIPSSNGFWVEELDRQANTHLSVETYNGQRYQVADLRKVIVYPQKSGTLTIKPMSLSIVAHIASRQRQRFSTGDPFFDQFLNDPFFSSFQTSYQSVKKKIYTNSITFNVKELPQKPDNYCGGVGKFTVSSDISTKQTKAYESFYLTYTLSGSGNLTLINNLPLDLPDEFQLSDPEITDNLQRDASGLSGSRTFRYIVIPRVEGKFRIPDLSISYYDIDKRDYDTLTLTGYNVQVAKGDVSNDYANQLDARLKYRNMNIKSNVKTSAWDKEFHIFDNGILYCVPFIMILLLAVTIMLFARHKRLSADIVTVKMKKSTKVAVKRLKKAKKFLDKGENESFEDETAIALWNYLEDRFKIDRTNLSIQGCKDELLSLNVDNNTVEKLGTILERCQYLRFSQDKEATADITLYNDTVEVISSIEEQMKNLKKIKKQKVKKPEHEIHIPTGLSILLITLFLFGISDLSFAQTIQQNSITKKRSATSSEQYCKTADSCFKASDYAGAMLYYEKALKLSPANKDIQLNINITRSRLVGDTYIMPQFVLVRWAKQISGLLPLPVWLILFLGFFAAACVLFFFYLFNDKKKVLLFYMTILALVISLSAMAFGIVRQNIQNDNSNAILMKSNIHLRETKNEGAKDVIIMYKGQKIKILEDDGSKWIKARTEDNKVGYMENKNFKRI
ncbi:MAG: BatD family protein [Bacteroidales bacterium]|nr:BatD family protein [Bacteroidales bacterium]